MSLDQIKEILQEKLDGKELVLDNSTFETLPLGPVLSVLDTDQFALTEAKLVISTESASVSGNISVLGSDEAGVIMSFTEEDGAEAFAMTVTMSSWQISEAKWLVMNEIQLAFSITGPDKAFAGSVTGNATIGQVEAELSTEIEDILTVSATVSRLNFTDITEQIIAGQVDIPDEIPDFEFVNVELSVTPKTGEFSLSGNAFDTPWEIPIGIDGLSIAGINFVVNRTVQDDNSKAVSGTIAGTLAIGSATFGVEYNFPGELILTGEMPSFSLSPLVQDLCGTGAVRNLPVPVSVLAVELTNISVTIMPMDKSISLSGASNFGQTEVIVQPVDGGKWGFGVGFAPPATWQFSTIADELKVLDSLNFSGTTLIVASSDDRSFDLATIELPNEDAKVVQGLNFFASMDLTATGVDELLGLESLEVYTAIGSNPANLVIEAGIGGQFQLSEGVAFGDITLRLVPAPSNFSLTLLGVVTAILDDSELRFVGGLQVTPRSALMQATMEGIWNEPFDTKGVAIANVALELGVSFPPPLPSIGLAGTLQVGNFAGMAAVKFDSAFPSRSMVAVAFNRLYLMDVISTFCGPTISQAIPQGLRDTVLNIGYEDVSVYIVPQPTQIGELSFEQGFTLQGTMVFWGLRAYAYVNIDYVGGIVINAEVDPIEIGSGLFTLRGVGGTPKPSLYFELSPTSTPSLDISGSISLLGLYSETQISFSDSGFYFKTTGRIYNLFEAIIEAQGGDLLDGGDFFIKVYMKNDLFAYLRTEASKAIKAAADSATRNIENAQRDVQNAQNQVNKINNDIANMRRTVQKERERDTRNLQNARNEVNKAQQEVNKINNNIKSMRNTINAERERDTRNLRNAQNEVNNAQNEVNKLQSQINSTKNHITKLKNDIKKKERWYKKSPWHKKSYRWAELSAYSAAKGAEITANYTKLGGLEAAKASAVGILEIAKQTLRGFEKAAKTIPVEADPRMIGLFSAREGATAALSAAKITLKGLEEAAKTFPIDADPRLIALFTARETATAGVQAAYYTLEGVKEAVGAMADVADFIAQYGLGGLLDIRSAYFEAYLNAAQGGNVAMDLSLTFMNQPQRLQFAFNFNNPLQSAQDLAKTLLPA